MWKRITIEQFKRALSLTPKVGIFIQGNFIFGDIEETVATANRTLSWWMKLLDYGLKLYMIRVFLGSHFYTYAIEKGIIIDRLRYLANGCSPINVSKLSEAEMKALRDKFHYLTSEYAGDTFGIHVLRISDEGAYDIKAECTNCGSLNIFSNLKIEYKNAFGADAFCCAKCSQKMIISTTNANSKGTYKVILDTALEQYFLPYKQSAKNFRAILTCAVKKYDLCWASGQESTAF